ncbi:hypothetical protein GOP47_0022896 [Adiantum capillus-veneris]|uniref:Uncharacterized protein n=1 Tax=Adiantum capillus-veneris TaxID=13818 RepID=A0A9D4U6P4_ADICA|nr:hypothetical protein GOP47_0022896 [Adiantum capillus-veneris]
MSDAKQSNVHVRDAHDRSTLGELDCCVDDEVPSSLNKDAGPISDDEADNNQPMYNVFNEDIWSEENALTVGCEIECCTKFSVEKLSKNLLQNERYVDEDDNPEWGFLDAVADIDNDIHVCVDEGMMHLDSGMHTKADSFTCPADFIDEETTIGDFLAALEDQDDGLEGACVQSEALQVPNASIVSVYTELKEANSDACKQFCFGVDGRGSSFDTEWGFDEPTIEMDACMTLKVQRAKARIEFLKLQQRYSNELGKQVAMLKNDGLLQYEDAAILQVGGVAIDYKKRKPWSQAAGYREKSSKSRRQGASVRPYDQDEGAALADQEEENAIKCSWQPSSDLWGLWQELCMRHVELLWLIMHFWRAYEPPLDIRACYLVIELSPSSYTAAAGVWCQDLGLLVSLHAGCRAFGESFEERCYRAIITSYAIR